MLKSQNFFSTYCLFWFIIVATYILKLIIIVFITTVTAWKVSVFEVFLVPPYSIEMRENTDQKDSEHGHFSRSEGLWNKERINYLTQQYSSYSFYCNILDFLGI